MFGEGASSSEPAVIADGSTLPPSRVRRADLFHVHRQSAYLLGRDRIVSASPRPVFSLWLVTDRALRRIAPSHSPRTILPLAHQVADIPIDHPSTSKQHAVLQFRQVVEKNEFGDTKSLTKCVAFAYPPSIPYHSSTPARLSPFPPVRILSSRADFADLRPRPHPSPLGISYTRGRPYIIDLDSANGTMVNDESVPASRYYEVKSGDGESLSRPQLPPSVFREGFA